MALGTRHENQAHDLRLYNQPWREAARFSRPAALPLDLGHVGDVEEVLAKASGSTAYGKAPYRLAIGPALRRGSDTLEVRVANLWVNRLIGDA